jgi:DNA-directed RNA polymerase subunit H (RpoH/RPB5)
MAFERGSAGGLILETLNHFLVPRVEVVQEKELAELLQKHGISIDALPKIRCDDAAVVAANAQAGAVLRFTRKSLVTNGDETYYRAVVD